MSNETECPKVPKQYEFIRSAFERKDLKILKAELSSVINILSESFSWISDGDEWDEMKEKKHILFQLISHLEKELPEKDRSCS